MKSQQFIKQLLQSPLTTRETILTIHKHVPGFNDLLYRNSHIAIECGNTSIAALIIEASMKAGKTPLNEAILKLLRAPETLTDQELLANQNTIIEKYPFREVAALDPTGVTLQRLIDLTTNKDTKESSLLLQPRYSNGGMTLYHFAAVCKTTKNLEILADIKFDFKKIDLEVT